MDHPPDRRDVRYRALADPTRRHLLRILDDSEVPVRLEDLARRVELHVNTVRGHLDLLERADLVERSTIARPGPGRPPVAFRSLPRHARSPGSEGYRFLAEILASSIQTTSDDPAETARQAGLAWGRFLATRPPPSSELAPESVTEQVVTTFAEMGFAPEPVTDGEGTTIRLHDCPFRDIARTRGDVVCSVHRGLLEGMLAEMGGTVGVDGLEAFVEPSLCVARISDR